MKSRRPTVADLRRLHRLYAAAGSREELIRWIDDALREGSRRHGPKPYKNRFTIGMLGHLFEAQGKDRIEIIKQLVRDGVIPGRGTLESRVERGRRDLRKMEKGLEQTMRRFEDQFRRRYPDLFRGMK